MALRKLPFWSILENCKTFKILPKNLKHKRYIFFIKLSKVVTLKHAMTTFSFLNIFILTFIPLPINKELCRIKFCLPADFILTKFLAQFFCCFFHMKYFWFMTLFGLNFGITVFQTIFFLANFCL